MRQQKLNSSPLNRERSRVPTLTEEAAAAGVGAGLPKRGALYRTRRSGEGLHAGVDAEGEAKTDDLFPPRFLDFMLGCRSIDGRGPR